MNKTIWIINQYASHLVTRHLELAKVFAANGYKVAVITSSFHHGRREYIFDDRIVFEDICDGAEYVYLHSRPAYKTNGAGRIFNMIDFCHLVLKNGKNIKKHIGSPDYIIASSAPPFVWEIGYKLARRFDAKFIAEFRDIWPLSLIDVQGVNPNHPLVKIFEIVEKRAYRHADTVVSTMPYAWKHVCDTVNVSRDKVFWMANGINTEEADRSLAENLALPIDLETFLSNNWCCVYIGSVVKSECVDYLIEAFNYANDGTMSFAIIGNGHEKENILELIHAKGIKNVELFAAVEKEQIPKVLSLSKVAFAAFDDLSVYEFGISMNKLNDYLYSGIPTLFVFNIDSVVNEAGQFVVPVGDKDKFAEALHKIKSLDNNELSILKEKSRSVIKENYDYSVIGQSYLEMLESIV